MIAHFMDGEGGVCRLHCLPRPKMEFESLGSSPGVLNHGVYSSHPCVAPWDPAFQTSPACSPLPVLGRISSGLRLAPLRLHISTHFGQGASWVQSSHRPATVLPVPGTSAQVAQEGHEPECQ